MLCDGCKDFTGNFCWKPLVEKMEILASMWTMGFEPSRHALTPILFCTGERMNEETIFSTRNRGKTDYAKDNQLGYRLLQESIASGDIESMATLGVTLLSGSGNPHEHQETIELLRFVHKACPSDPSSSSPARQLPSGIGG
jgi:hypothetical protein